MKTVRDVDWIITNPPFKQAEEFAAKALSIAKRGVAIFARSVFAESIGRHQRLFSKFPPTKVAQFAERVPIVKGRLDAKASTATGYAWFVWEKPLRIGTEYVWIAASRKALERTGDYGPPQLFCALESEVERISLSMPAWRNSATHMLGSTVYCPSWEDMGKLGRLAIYDGCW